MLRTLLAALALLHLGPGLAFAVLAFGCEGVAPVLGDFCARSQLGSFLVITLAVWLPGAVALWWRHRQAATRPIDA